MEITNTWQAGDTITARNPQTGNTEQATVVRFTSHRWLHVDFGNGQLIRLYPSEVKESA